MNRKVIERARLRLLLALPAATVLAFAPAVAQAKWPERPSASCCRSVPAALPT